MSHVVVHTFCVAANDDDLITINEAQTAVAQYKQETAYGKEVASLEITVARYTRQPDDWDEEVSGKWDTHVNDVVVTVSQESITVQRVVEA